MERLYSYFFIFLFLAVGSIEILAQDLSPNRIAQALSSRKVQRNLEIPEYTLFTKIIDLGANARSASLARSATLITPNRTDLREIERDRPVLIALTIPFENGVLELELYQQSPLTNDYLARTSDGQTLTYTGIHYRGIIKNDYQSIASLSVFENEIIGVISSSDLGNVVIGKWDEGNKYHVIYKDQDLLLENEFLCQDLRAPEDLKEIKSSPVNEFNRAVAKCVRVYFETDYALYVNKGSSESAVQNFVSGFFNNVTTLYENEGLNIEMSELFIWTSQDPYPTHSASAAMDDFKNRRPNFNGDLAHLVALGGQATGGIAYLDVLCSSAHAYAYSDIASNYAQFPTYSWTVNVVAHEIGHNYGSPHTHACEWTVGGLENQALDDCYATEGDCPSGPEPVNGGTIMSYCHVKNIGINFNNGFGPLPGDLIRASASVASCLQDCGNGGGGGCSLAITNVQINSATCNLNNGMIIVQISGSNGSVSYDIGFGPQSSNSFSEVAPGNYTIVVKNGMNCQRSTTAVVNMESSQPGIGATVTNATCAQSDGVIELAAMGGEAPYIYKVGNKTQSNPIFSNLPSGNYTCRIVDNNSCSVSKVVSIFSSEGPLLSVEEKPTSCGLENGQINLSAQGGAHPYEYRLDNQSSSTGKFENLSPGNYVAQVIDNNGCADNENISIKSSTALTANAEVQHTECGLDNGKITVQTIGGTGTKIYSIGGAFQISNQFDNVAPGTYQVRVQDGADCLTSFDIVVNDSESFSTSYLVESTSCAQKNGSIEINTEGATGPYEYKLGDESFNQEKRFEDLAPGPYHVEVKDAQSCIISNEIIIESSTIPTPLIDKESTHCGLDNGRISITIEGGIAPYQYRIDSVFQDQPGYDQLSSGIYTIVTKDAANCFDSLTVQIDSSEQVNANLEMISTRCGEANGSITVQPLSGIGPFSYKIDADIVSSDSIFSDLGPGSYRIQILDSDQCSWIDSAEIAPSNAINLIVEATHTSCGLENGKINLIANGGTGILSYSIRDTFTQKIQFLSLPSASYTVQVKDEENCLVDTIVQIDASTNPVLDPTLIHTRCGENNGRINLKANQGQGPYTFIINGIELDGTFLDHISPAEYRIGVKDSYGCLDSSLITIQSSSAPVLQFETKDANCYQPNGSVNVHARLGLTPYRYSIGENFTPDTIFTVDSGLYLLIVEDGDQCYDTSLVEVGYDDRYKKPEVAPQLDLCQDESLLLESGLESGPDIFWIQNSDTIAFDSLRLVVYEAGTIEILVNHTDNCVLRDSTHVMLREKPVQNLVATDTLCYGEVFSIADPDSMLKYNWSNDSTGFQVAFRYSDKYRLTVLNAFGCSIQKELDMTVVEPVILETNRTILAICPGDSLRINVVGADEYVWYNANGEMTGISIPNPVVFPEKETSYQVVGSNQCFSDTITFSVGILENNSQITPDTLIIEGAPLELFVEGALDAHWNSPFHLSCDTCDNPVIRPEESGIVKVRYTDSHACEWEGQVIIEIIPLEEVIPDLPNVITPNQDGQNDKLVISGADYFASIKLKVVNQQGLTIFEDTQYHNDWDGEFEGKKLPEGVYFYLVTLFLDDRIFQLDSDLLIVRD